MSLELVQYIRKQLTLLIVGLYFEFSWRLISLRWTLVWKLTSWFWAYDSVRMVHSDSSFPLRHCHKPSHRWVIGRQVSLLFIVSYSQLKVCSGQPASVNYDHKSGTCGCWWIWNIGDITLVEIFLRFS